VAVGGSKTVLNACFLGVSAKTYVHRQPGFRNILDAIAASDVNECLPVVTPSLCSHIYTTFCAQEGQSSKTRIEVIVHDKNTAIMVNNSNNNSRGK
jgi:hypothetical protein